MSALKAQENAKKMKLTQKVIGKRNGKCRTGKARCTKSSTSKVQHTFCDDCDTDDCCDDDDDGDDDDHQDVANNSCEEPDYDPCEEIEEMSESANSDEENSASNCVTQPSKRFKVDKTFPSKCRDRQKSVRRGQIDSGEENRNTTESLDDLKGLKSPSMSSSSKMWVQPTSTDSKGKRKWDKYHYCVYCEKKYAKLPRHFQQKHKEEIKVCQAFSFPKGSKQRRLHLKRLMNRGNHAHNCKVLEKGSGNIVVRKRPTYEAAVYDYLPCTHCLAYFVRGDVSKHEKVCPFRPVKDEEGSASKSYRRLQGKSALLLPVGKDASIGLRENVLARMNVDAVSMVVRGDRLIKQFGENLYKKQGLGSDFQYVSQQMRELGRLVIAMREVTNDDELTLTHCIDPQMFDKVIKGVQNVSGYDEMNSAYKVPSLVMKLGKSLRKCGMICKGNAIKTEDQHLENKAQRFLQLADVQWEEEISSNALKTISERKRNKTMYLQLVSDMAKLHKHMKRIASESAKQLKADPNEKAWAELCRVTLAQMILFNRRRSSEMSRMTMDDYENIHRGINEGVDSCLSSFEDHLCQKMNVVEVWGKRGRNVPVILTSCLKDQVDLLVSSRNKVGINKKNKYVFACLKNSELPVHGSTAIRKYADSAGLLAPDVVTSTGLRKQIATLSQVFNLTEHEMDIIAGFIGHDIRIHKLPNHTLQVAKLGRILMAFEEGNITQFKGKTLDEIEVDSYELSEEEEEADDKEENVDGLHTVEAGKTDDVTVDDMDISDDHGNFEGNKKDAAVTHNEEDTKRKKKWTKWTVEEHETVMKHFQKEIRLLKLPGKTDCEACKKKYPVLFAKSWSDIKYHVYNKIKQRKAKV
ncbi:uncharacterized protein [Ptychodera flava]|uniref:uncharacterized protein n=1 Tax=Ptychodera flava TaxID=63121 RepID=UPI003969FC0B